MSILSCPVAEIGTSWGMKANKVPPDVMEMVAQRFKTMGEPMRLRLLHSLESGEKNVGELMRAVQSTQGNVSKHLGLLTQSGLVGRRREGAHVYYFIQDPVVFDICRLVCSSLLQDQNRKGKQLKNALG